MMRTERFNRATLILGDCRDMMPGLQADVVLTDPVWPNCPKCAVPGANDPWGLWRDACAALPPVKRVLVVMRCDSDPRFLGRLPPLPFLRCIILPYVMPSYLGRVLGGDEVAYWFGSPIVSAPNRRVIPGRAPAVQPNKRLSDGHPMSRAQEHFDWLVGWCSDPGEVVLDPFMGSGTTLVAATRHGRHCIGIEVHPPFFDLACRRVEAAQRQAEMFVD